jgi:hypothetical protein
VNQEQTMPSEPSAESIRDAEDAYKRHVVEQLYELKLRSLDAKPGGDKPAGDGLLSEEQAATVAGVSRKQIRTMILSGRLEADDWGTGKRKHYRIKVEALAKLQPRPAEPRPQPRQRRSHVARAAPSIFPNVN